MTDLAHRPVETMEFGALRIRFDRRVLRPRPWTIAQSEWAADVIDQAPDGGVLELCAGAGQIGLLAVLASGRALVAVDVDPVACRFARENAVSAGIADRVEVRREPIDRAVRAEERFAVVIADPPWVRRGRLGRYPDDPIRAIDGGDDGLDVARACLSVGLPHLRPGGRMLLQLGTVAQAERLADTDAVEIAEVRRYDHGVVARLDADPRNADIVRRRVGTRFGSA